MDYSPSALRGTRARDGFLALWGQVIRDGYAPPAPTLTHDRPRLASTHRPRTPCPDFLPDCTRAFLALNPATVGQPTHPYATLRYYARLDALDRYDALPGCTRDQAAIWYYYVADLGHPDRLALATVPTTQRDTFLDLLADLERHDPTLPAHDDHDPDARVAARIPKQRGPGTISPQRANDLRNAAIVTMATFLGWHPSAHDPGLPRGLVLDSSTPVKDKSGPA